MSDPGAPKQTSSVQVGGGAPPTVVPLGAPGAGPEEPPPLTNPRWGSRDYLHDDEVEMLVDAPSQYNGRTVRFVVEQCRSGRWEQLAEATGVVRHGVAVGLVAIPHPAAKQRTGMHFAPGADTGPRTMRFKASLA